MAQFDVAVVAYKAILTSLQQKFGLQRLQYQKENLLVLKPEIVSFTNPRFEAVEGDSFQIVDSVCQKDLERLGFLSVEKFEYESNLVKQDYFEEVDVGRTKQSLLALCGEFERVQGVFSQAVGSGHVYCNEARLAVISCQKLAEKSSEMLEFNNVVQEKHTGIMTQIHDQGDYVQRALEGFGQKFAKIPKRAMYVEVKKAGGKKGGKKGKKAKK